MLHPHTELQRIGPNVGFGVVATHFIPQGTITWVLDDLDLRLSPARVEELAKEPTYRDVLTHFGFHDKKGNTIVCWDAGKSVNHSCDPNCSSGGYDLVEVALRDIQPGEQLSDDYREFVHKLSFECECGTSLCSGGVVPPRREEARERVRGRVRAALPFVSQVDQPLLRLVERRPELKRFLAAVATANPASAAHAPSS